MKKLKKRVEDGVEEVIIAISPTIEGEMTSIFIKEVLKDFDLVLTKIASGIPVGGNLEYFDGDTLFKALEDRRIIRKRKVDMKVLVKNISEIATPIGFEKKLV